MSQSDEGNSASFTSLDAPARLLRRLADACRVSHDPAALGRRLEDMEQPSGASIEDSLEWLAGAARDLLGMRTSLARANAEEALAVLRSGQPLITRSPDGSRWFFVVGKSGRRLTVTAISDGGAEEVQRVAPGDLAQSLGYEQANEVTWIVAGASTPQQGAVSSSSGSWKMTPFRRLLALLEPERGDILAVFGFSIAVGVLMLATPIAVQAIVNSVGLGGLLQPLVVVALLLLLALGVAAALTGVQTWVVEHIQRRLFIRAVADLTARLPRVRMDTHDRIDVRELVNRFFDIVTVQKIVAKLLLDALGVMLSILVGLTVLAFYHPLLLAFDIVLLFVIVIVVWAPLRRGERTAIVESSAKYEVVAWLEEIAANPYAFKAAGSQQWIFERADALSRKWVEARSTHFRTIFAQIMSALVLQMLASTALLGIGGFLVIQGSLTLGQLVAAELIVTIVVASVAKMGKHLEGWYDLMAGVYKVGHLLDLPVETHTGEHHPVDGSQSSEGSQGAALDVVRVASQDGHGHMTLPEVSFHAKPGERIGIAGPLGAGKTTLVELLWRLREPSEGVIRLDDRDIRDLAVEYLRREVGVASPVEVVHGTVRANVKLQRPFVSNDVVRRVVEAVGLEEAIAELPDGLETVLRPAGRQLSDGERRRLMLARAMAGSPRLLVVDDLCDTMHPELRAALFDALFDPQAGWTLIVVSELPEVLDRCDRVLRLPAHGTADRVTLQ